MKKVISQSEIKKIINSNNVSQLKDYLKIKEEQDVFNILLGYIEKLLDNFDVSYVSVIYKILGFLEEISYEEEANLMNKCSTILTIRDRLVERIKNVNKKARKRDKKIIFFKEIVNRLENLEINITYNLKSPVILSNYNIVKYIIFSLKDLNYSKNLIKNNAHLINAFNLKSEDILCLVVDSYIDAIDCYVKFHDSYDLFYFDIVLEEILKSDKIKKDSALIEKLLLKLNELDKTKGKNNKELNKASYWYKHLFNKLDNINYEDDLETLNNLYDVNFYYKNDVLLDGKERSKKLYKTSVDMTDDFIFTIDDISCYERDDAISVKKMEPDLYQLKIFIADPNALFDVDSLIYQDARRRGETLYLQNKSIGMFPEEIIKKYLSLDENKSRFVREYVFNITSGGVIEDFKINKRKVVVNKNYSYGDINDYLKNPLNGKQEIILEDLVSLKEILNKKFINDKVVSTLMPMMTTSENIIETYMVFLNNKLAEFFSSRGIPFVYRYHPHSLEINPDGVDIRGISDENKSEYKKIIRKLEKTSLSAKYSVDMKSHDALSLDYYSHSTSPLRRFADNLVNECEDNFYFSRLNDKDTDLFLDYLKNEVTYINNRIMGLDRYLSEYERAKIRSRNSK